jgi:hypothetical protein
VSVETTDGGGATLAVSLPLRDDSTEGRREDGASEDLGSHNDGQDRGSQDDGRVIHI